MGFFGARTTGYMRPICTLIQMKIETSITLNEFTNRAKRRIIPVTPRGLHTRMYVLAVYERLSLP